VPDAEVKAARRVLTAEVRQVVFYEPHTQHTPTTAKNNNNKEDEDSSLESGPSKA
jgi:hypothetical protein